MCEMCASPQGQCAVKRAHHDMLGYRFFSITACSIQCAKRARLRKSGSRGETHIPMASEPRLFWRTAWWKRRLRDEPPASPEGQEAASGHPYRDPAGQPSGAAHVACSRQARRHRQARGRGCQAQAPGHDVAPWPSLATTCAGVPRPRTRPPAAAFVRTLTPLRGCVSVWLHGAFVLPEAPTLREDSHYCPTLPDAPSLRGGALRKE